MNTITTVTGVEYEIDAAVVMKNIQIMHRRMVVELKLSEIFRTDLGKQIVRTTLHPGGNWRRFFWQDGASHILANRNKHAKHGLC